MQDLNPPTVHNSLPFDFLLLYSYNLPLTFPNLMSIPKFPVPSVMLNCFDKIMIVEVTNFINLTASL